MSKRKINTSEEKAESQKHGKAADVNGTFARLYQTN